MMESLPRYYKSIIQPTLVEEYFESASKIDDHNHFRQGSLALEEAWGTKKCIIISLQPFYE